MVGPKDPRLADYLGLLLMVAARVGYSAGKKECKQQVEHSVEH